MSDENRSPVHHQFQHARKIVELMGGPPWGLRIQGGKDSGIQLKVARVNPGSKAAKCGIRDGDLISSINGQPTEDLTNVEVQKIIKKSGDCVRLELKGASKRMGTVDGGSGLSVSAANEATDGGVASTSLSTSQLSSGGTSSGAPAVPVPSSVEYSINNATSTTSSPPVVAATPPLTKAEKKEKKKSEKKKKSGQSPSKSSDDIKASKKSGKHHHQHHQQQSAAASPPQQQKPEKKAVTSLSSSSGDHAISLGVGLEDSNGGSNKWENGVGSTGSPHQQTEEKQRNNHHNNVTPSSVASTLSRSIHNGKISGVSSSLLGDIIAELDDLLDADFFNGSSTNFIEQGVWPPPSISSAREDGAGTNIQSSSTPQQPQQRRNPPPTTVPVIPIRPPSTGNNVESSSCSDLPNLEQGSEGFAPVWTPPSAQASPSSQKKFRPVNFNVPGSPKSSTPKVVSLDRSSSSPQLPIRQSSLQQSLQQSPISPHQPSFPLLQTSASQGLLEHQQRQKEVVSSPEQNDNSSRSDSTVYQTSSGSISQATHQASSSLSTVSLPKYQSPTVTLLQKAREGQLPKGAHYLDQQQQNSPRLREQRSVSSLSENRSRTVAGLILDLEENTPPVREVGKRITDTGVEFDGIGPTTPEGVPIATRPAIKSEQQHNWYKRMYESLHVERPQRRDYMTVKYKKRKGPRQLHGVRHSAGHYSEPEGYESDTYTYNKYATLDRRKLRDRYSESTDYFSPSPSTPNSILSPTSSCPPSGLRFNPGRIADYTPGNSCVIAKEIRRHKPTLQWALGSRDLGYESDSNLIVRKRGLGNFGIEDEPEYRGIKSPPPPPLSPAEQRQLYVDIQKGGEVPLKGLRKPAPERPKESTWLDLLRNKVSKSMPTFDEMKKTLPRFSNRGRSTSRSGSPVCKSPPPNSTVALLQERIQEKIRRSNSDLSPRPSQSFRSRYGLSGVDASRIIHTVRSSTQTIRRSTSSSIPIRSRETSVEKLRVSSPELISPREVKKAMQGNGTSTYHHQQQHRLSIKLEVVKGSPSKKGKDPEGKKAGTKKTANGKTTLGKSANLSSLTKQKSVKISDKVSVENNNHRSISSVHNKNGGTIPIKPPRKVKVNKTVDTSSSIAASPLSSFIDSCGKVHKISKVSPAASRHASCLVSRNVSRPTSPGSGYGGGGGVSSTISTSNNSLNNVATTGSKPSGSEKIMGSSGKFASSSGGKQRTKAVGESGSITVATSATGTKGGYTTPGRKLIRESGGVGRLGNGTNRINLSVGKDDRKSPDKERQLQKSSTSKATSSSLSATTTIPTKVKGSGIESYIRHPNKARSTSNIDLFLRGSVSTFPAATKKRDQEASRFWTIPPRKLRREIASLERPSSLSLFSFSSLPALTPYLTETKRVSESLFLSKQLPLVRQTKTSALREKLAHDLPEPLSSTQTKSSERTTARSTKRGGDTGGEGGRIIRSVSCLTLKEKLIRDYTYTNYILELQHARKRSPRFLQLHRFYSSLERLGQLERSTSLYDIPVLSAEKQLDFEAWWKVRNRLRVEEEMSSILNQLMHAQRNREFFFRPKSPEQVRWKGDSALRCKQWNIDELRHFLLTGELLKSKHTSTSDLHKTAWRGTSVKEVALNMEVASSLSKTSDYYYYRDKHADYIRMPSLRRAFSMSSTLSDDQKEKIKSRLGTLIVKKDKEELHDGRGGTGSSLPMYNVIPTVRTSRMGTIPPMRNSPSPLESDIGIDGTLTETAKRQISKTISDEVHERKMKEKAEQQIYFQKQQQRIIEGSSANMKSSTGTSGAESESDSSLKTVIHIPISTKMLLRKCQEQQQHQQQNSAGTGTKGKSPVYPVYCTKGVPSKVSFFETFHSDSNNNKEPIVVSSSPVSEAKIIKTKTYPEKVRLLSNREENKHMKGNMMQTTPASRPKSPAAPPLRMTEKRSSSPTRPFDNRYMSHINVISKLASLLLKRDSSLKTLVQREMFERDRLERLRMVNAGEVDRLKHYFEDHPGGVGGSDYDSLFLHNHPEISLLRCLFCSDPNLARLTEKINLGQNITHHTRRCASADIFKEKLDYFEKGDRIRPDGKESSPVHSRSPELYFSSRSRRPIYQPSSTPNICQPTLTAHCFLESPTKSMEFDTSCYSSDFSGNYWDYNSTSPAPSSNAAQAIPYSPPPQTRRTAMKSSAPTATGPPLRTSTPIISAGSGNNNNCGIPSNPMSNRDGVIYSTIQPRILESRVPPPNINELGKNWNFDPSLHQPKYRYVPQPPIIEPQKQYYSHYGRIGSSLSSLQQPTSLPMHLQQPPPIPPAPGSVNYYHHYHHHQQQPGRLQKSESFHATTSTSHVTPPHLYRSVRYWNPNLQRGQSSGASSREYHRNHLQAVDGRSNTSIQLQRSASLNYANVMLGPAPPKSPDYLKRSNSNISNHLESPKEGGSGVPSTIINKSQNYASSANSTTTDIDNQIQLIENESQFCENGIDGSSERNVVQARNHDDDDEPGNGPNTTANNITDATAAVARRMLQLENASSSSPVKYAESEVNIHYKAPIRVVEKEFIAEDELRRRQEIAMRRFYEEQRQRKFLQEIQDMENRRNNFTPSQKSPIPLNRYDDVIDELPTKTSRWREKTPESTRLAARALYNFMAQNSRELSFRKGDILFVRRKVDSNWYEGEHNAAVGIFPCSYVEVIPAFDIERATPRTASEGQAKVRFNFTAATPAEMSIIKGETVVLTRRVDMNWYEGRIGARRGIFPVSYIHVIKEPGTDISSISSAMSPKPIGAPAAHSLVTQQQNGGGGVSGGIMYNTSKHSYKPNEYSLGADLSNIDAFINAQTSSPNSAARIGKRKEIAYQPMHPHHQQSNRANSNIDPGRNRYAQNLTIDTRIEPIQFRAVYNYKPAHEDELELMESDILHVIETCEDGWLVGTSQRTGLFGTFPGNYVERIY